MPSELGNKVTAFFGRQPRGRGDFKGSESFLFPLQRILSISLAEMDWVSSRYEILYSGNAYLIMVQMRESSILLNLNTVAHYISM